MKHFFTILILLVSALSIAQTGTISGTLTDKETAGGPLPFANVIIKGTQKGAQTDFDGKYTITNVEPGTYTIEFSFVGYQTAEVTNVVVTANNTTIANTELAAGAQLDEVIVKTTVRKETEAALLLDQKKAATIKQSIGAQELARKGVSDAAGAVAKGLPPDGLGEADALDPPLAFWPPEPRLAKGLAGASPPEPFELEKILFP